MHSWSRSAVLVAAFLVATAAIAQQALPSSGRVDFAVTYDASYAGLVQGNAPFWMNGDGAELSIDAFHGFGFSAHVMGFHTANTGSGVPLNLVTTTFGPHYTWHPRLAKRSLSIFGEGLIGEAHGFKSVFPSTSGSSISALSFASEAGGGIDLDISHHVSIRLVEASWLRTQFPNSSLDVQNNLALGAGLVIHSATSRH